MSVDIAKYNEIVAKANNCVNWFEKLDIKNNKINFYLANGDILNIRIFEANIAHLLGFNISYLNMTNKFNKDLSNYDKLKYVLEKPYIFKNLLINNDISTDFMFSDSINQKLAVFKDNLSIRSDDIYCVIKYDNEKTYQAINIPDPCDYYIIRKKRNNYLVLGLINDGNVYTPVTSRLYDDKEKFDEFMNRVARKQEITYPHLLNINNSYRDYKVNAFFPLSEKEYILNNIINISQKYSATPAVARDYAFTINKFKTVREDQNINLNILRLLSDSIKSGTVLDENTINQICGTTNDIPGIISTLISICNDILCDSTSLKNSTLKAKNNELNARVNQLELELAEEKLKNQNVEHQLNQLLDENTTYKSQLDVYDQAYQKVMTLRKHK
ncbi:MAG: PBECR4 domain-containing protein [bacterium]|nr:PBECR4 domain-containing protein [bacterium]